MWFPLAFFISLCGPKWAEKRNKHPTKREREEKKKRAFFSFSRSRNYIQTAVFTQRHSLSLSLHHYGALSQITRSEKRPRTHTQGRRDFKDEEHFVFERETVISWQVASSSIAYTITVFQCARHWERWGSRKHPAGSVRWRKQEGQNRIEQNTRTCIYMTRCNSLACVFFFILLFSSSFSFLNCSLSLSSHYRLSSRRWVYSSLRSFTLSTLFLHSSRKRSGGGVHGHSLRRCRRLRHRREQWV